MPAGTICVLTGLIISAAEKKTIHSHFSQGLSSQINAVCSHANYNISMVEDAVISPFSEYVVVFNSSVHSLCSSSDWTGIICICPCLLAVPQSSPRCESDCFHRVTHLLSTELDALCVCVVFLVWASNLHYPICEPTLRWGTFCGCLCVVWLDREGTEWKPNPLQSAVMSHLAWTSIGSHR